MRGRTRSLVGVSRDQREKEQIDDRNGHGPWARRPPPVTSRADSRQNADGSEGRARARASLRPRQLVAVHSGTAVSRRLITRGMRSATTARADGSSPPLVQPSLAQAEGGEVLGALARTNARPVLGTAAAGCR